MDETARIIRQCMDGVAGLRQRQAADAQHHARVLAVKRWQTRRFAGSYAALLRDPRHGPAARFFMDEIYGVADYSERDRQFGRIAGALERLFPQQVAQTAVALARVHALTESLDDELAAAVPALPADNGELDCATYIAAWRQVGRREQRLHQLEVVLDLGRQLDRLTRLPGLRIGLRMMRGPAHAAGLASLQAFLESGFDTFAAMRGADAFLATIDRTERALIASLFDDEPVACGTTLESILGQAR